MAFETDSAGSTVGLRYTWGQGTDQLLAVRDAAGNHFYTTRDRLGSVRTLTTSAGVWKLSEAFTPYGTSLVRDMAGTGIGVALRYRWTGREYDAETGFYYLRARYYSPDMRRFVREDPAGRGNLYAYVDGGPLEATDPSGMVPSSAGAYLSWERSQFGGGSPACEFGCGWSGRCDRCDSFVDLPAYGSGYGGFYSPSTQPNEWGIRWKIDHLLNDYAQYKANYLATKARYEDTDFGRQLYGSQGNWLSEPNYDEIHDIVAHDLPALGQDGLRYAGEIAIRVDAGRVFVNPMLFYEGVARAALTTAGSGSESLTAFRPDAFNGPQGLVMNSLVHEQWHANNNAKECPAYTEAYRVTGVYHPGIRGACR